MGLNDTLAGDLKAALKARDKLRTGTIKLLIADVRNTVIAKGRELSEAEDLALLAKHAKQRREAMAAYEAGGRDDLAAQERGELAIIEEYLPSQLGEAEVSAIIDDVIKATGATSKRDMGRVMGQLMPKLKGRFDGKLAKSLVEQALS